MKDHSRWTRDTDARVCLFWGEVSVLSFLLIELWQACYSHALSLLLIFIFLRYRQ